MINSTYKNFQVARKQLLICLILLFVITIIMTVVFNIIPRAAPTGSAPKTHSVANFNSNSDQLVEAGDMLIGKGVAKGYATVLITPGGHSERISIDKIGEWKYQIPITLAAGKYYLTITLEDKAGNLASVKTYPLQLNKLSQ